MASSFPRRLYLPSVSIGFPFAAGRTVSGYPTIGSWWVSNRGLRHSRQALKSLCYLPAIPRLNFAAVTSLPRYDREVIWANISFFFSLLKTLLNIAYSPENLTSIRSTKLLIFVCFYINYASDNVLQISTFPTYLNWFCQYGCRLYKPPSVYALKRYCRINLKQLQLGKQVFI